MTYARHLSNACELYFAKFYQYKERLKKLSKAVEKVAPDHALDFGGFIRRFDREFSKELKARNIIHHHEDFDELGLSRITLLEILEHAEKHKPDKQEVRNHYRKAAKAWASRVKHRALYLNQYSEATAEALLKCCPFLRDFEPKS